MRSNFSFDATGLYGVLYDMPASRVGTYETHLDTDVTAQVYTDPAVERTFRPFYSRRFTPATDRQLLTDHPRHFHLLTDTRRFTLERDSDSTHHPRIIYVGTNTRVLDMKGTGDE